MCQLKKIGLTGGIATGKSTVARMFSELGAVILDADRVAREVVRPGMPCWHKLRDLLGPGYFDPNGELERRKLRERIIQDPHFRGRINAIFHPFILAAMEGEWEEALKDHPGLPVIFDVPLLFEVNLAPGFDVIILAYTTPEIQIQRLIIRDALSRREAEQTLTMQLPIEEKKNRADIIIDNSFDPDDTRKQVEAAWEKLCGAGG